MEFLDDDYEGELGKTFFGKIFQKVGQGVKAVANVVKKVATTPVRLGILAYMKLNVGQQAAKLRFGYIPYGPEVAQAGYGPQAHAQIVDSATRLRNYFVKTGGNEGSLRMAILTGNGNRDRAVSSSSPALAGLGDLLIEHDADWQALQQINSLHDPVPAVAGLNGLHGPTNTSSTNDLIGLVAKLIGAILSALSKAKPNDPNDPVPDEYLPQDDPGSDGSGDEVNGFAEKRELMRQKYLLPTLEGLCSTR